MSRVSLAEKMMRQFSGDETVVFTENEVAHRDRLLHVLDIRMQNLFLSDFRIYEIVKDTYDTISYPQVMRDISVVERMVAHEKDPTGDPMKVFTRYFIAEVAKDAIKMAKKKKDPYTMAYAANIIGKHRLTDKEDVMRPPYDEIIPFVPELTTDPSVLGMKPDPNIETLRAKLKKKFNLEADNYVNTIVIRKPEPTTDEPIDEFEDAE